MSGGVKSCLLPQTSRSSIRAHAVVFNWGCTQHREEKCNDMLARRPAEAQTSRGRRAATPSGRAVRELPPTVVGVQESAVVQLGLGRGYIRLNACSSWEHRHPAGVILMPTGRQGAFLAFTKACKCARDQHKQGSPAERPKHGSRRATPYGRLPLRRPRCARGECGTCESVHRSRSNAASVSR